MSIPQEDRKSIAQADALAEKIKERPDVEIKVDLTDLAEELAKRRKKSKTK